MVYMPFLKIIVCFNVKGLSLDPHPSTSTTVIVEFLLSLCGM